MNVEYLLWIIRRVNLLVHVLAGLLCIISFIINLVNRKGSAKHINTGKLFGIGTMFLLGTSIVSFIILGIFPFFLMAYMAYYLYYSSILKTINNKFSFSVHYSLAIFTAAFYLSKGRIGGYYEEGYAYLFWGVIFSVVLVWDFYRLFLQKDLSKRQFLFVHANRIILSFFFVFTAFMVSQFSSKEPHIVYILCFLVPVIFTGLLLFLNNVILVFNKKIGVKISMFVVVMFIGLVAVESVARVSMVKPVSFFFYNDTMENKPHSSLKLDEDGIYKHNSTFIDSIEVLKASLPNKSTFYNKDAVTTYFLLSYLAQTNDVEQVEKAILPYHKGVIGDDIIYDIEHNGYVSFVDNLKQKFDSIQDTLLRQKLVDYSQKWINDDGFRSIAIENYNTSRKKILLLGDSFTYGQSAMPLYNSYADLLLSEGNVVVNLGIPSTNVINYYANAKKYIPRFQPDVVFTFYFPINDHIYFPWDTTSSSFLPNHMIKHVWVPSIVKSNYYPDLNDWERAVNDCLDENLSFSLFNFSVIYHIIINKFFTKKISKCFPNSEDINVEMTHYYLKKIEQVCKENGSKHFIIVIPPYGMDMDSYELKTKNNIFKDMEVYYPKNFVKDDYKTAIGDPHFSNLGHQKMNDYILEILETSNL